MLHDSVMKFYGGNVKGFNKIVIYLLEVNVPFYVCPHAMIARVL